MASLPSEILAFYYSRNGTELWTRSGGSTTTSVIGAIPTDGTISMRNFTNPFGIDVDIIGLEFYCSSSVVVADSNAFFIFQRTADWVYLHRPVQINRKLIGVSFNFPKRSIRLAAADQILEEIAPVNGATTSFGCTIYAKAAPSA